MLWISPNPKSMFSLWNVSPVRPIDIKQKTVTRCTNTGKHHQGMVNLPRRWGTKLKSPFSSNQTPLSLFTTLFSIYSSRVECIFCLSDWNFIVRKFICFLHSSQAGCLPDASDASDAASLVYYPPLIECSTKWHLFFIGLCFYGVISFSFYIKVYFQRKVELSSLWRKSRI